MPHLLVLAVLLCAESFPPVNALSGKIEDKAGASDRIHLGATGASGRNWLRATGAGRSPLLPSIVFRLAPFAPRDRNNNFKTPEEGIAPFLFAPRDPNNTFEPPKEGNWTIAGTYFFMAVLLCCVLFAMKPPNNQEEGRAWRNNARSVRAPVEEATASPPPPAKEFIKIQDGAVAPAGAAAEELSGQWRGYYEQYGSSQLLCEFTLVFENGQVSGDGVDEVGAYNITGLSSEGCRRIAFSKQYILESEASSGQVNSEENLGHVVEYRGTAAGPQVTTSGLRGTWYIQNSQYTGQGAFHIWPVEGLQSPSAMRARKEFLKRHPTFEISEESVCVICFDCTIDVVLDPCGHVVVCEMCAKSLNPHRCPICRLDIQQILSVKGAASQEAGSSEQP